MKKNHLIILLSILLIGLVTALILTLTSSPERSPVKSKSTAAEVVSDSIEAETELVNIKLFFLQDHQAGLIYAPIEYELENKMIRAEMYMDFLDLLIRQGLELDQPLPPGIVLRGVFYIESQKLLFVDFNDQLADNFPGGTSAEMEFINFIVNNICYNFREVEMVKFLISGNEANIISGHLDIETPYYPDFSYLRDE